MTVAAQKKRRYRCAICGRRLPPDRYIYSRWTRARYCWPTDGCNR